MPLPPMSVSSPFWPSIRVAGRREHAVDLVDPDGVVAVAGLDIDGAERAEVEREVGGAVVADVDLELGPIDRTQAERDPVRMRGPPGCAACRRPPWP